MTRNGARWTRHEDLALRVHWFDRRTTRDDMVENIGRPWPNIRRRAKRLALGPRRKPSPPQKPINVRKMLRELKQVRFEAKAEKARFLVREGWTANVVAAWCGLSAGQVRALGT